MWYPRIPATRMISSLHAESIGHLGAFSGGGFHKWGYPNSWLVYKGKSIYKVDENWGYPHLWKPSCGFFRWKTPRLNWVEEFCDPLDTDFWFSL